MLARRSRRWLMRPAAELRSIEDKKVEEVRTLGLAAIDGIVIDNRRRHADHTLKVMLSQAATAAVSSSRVVLTSKSGNLPRGWARFANSTSSGI
jgi:hypothetical protein